MFAVLLGVGGCWATDQPKKRTAMLLVYAVEVIYQLKNPNFIGPVSFAKCLYINKQVRLGF